MKASQYFKESMSTINKALVELNGKQSPTCKSQNSMNTSENNTLVIVCFGLGPFTENLLAFHQFAFILSVQEYLSAQSEYNCHGFYYDPVFSLRERKILQDLKCTVLEINTEGRYPLDGRTLFYLPHCPNALTNNLLESNWLPEQLHKIILINNSFLNLSLSKPVRLLRSDSNLILDILPFTKEVPLIDNYFVSGIFNDLSLHIFPMKEMPNTNDTNFWQKRAAKTDIDHGELIMNLNLQQHQPYNDKINNNIERC